MHDVRKLLKITLVPELRKAGFHGAFPHFRRIRKKQIDLLTFQFDLHGSRRFVIELAKAPRGPFTTHWGQQIPESSLTAHDLKDRWRLGAPPAGDRWFSLEKGEEDTLKTIIDLFMSQGEEYFRAGR